MKQTNEFASEKSDKDILYSKTVKAGKRVYYIDVKRDRRDALYLSITESKKLKDVGTEEHPVFEKHKIFLYREDVMKFMAALTSATDFTMEHAPAPHRPPFREHSWEKPEDYFSAMDRDERDFYDNEMQSDFKDTDQNIKFDIDF